MHILEEDDKMHHLLPRFLDSETEAVADCAAGNSYSTNLEAQMGSHTPKAVT